MTDQHDAPDLRSIGDASVPLKWVGAAGGVMLGAAVGVITMTFTLGGYKTSIDDQLTAMNATVTASSREIEKLQDEDRRQIRVLNRIDRTMDRIADIACTDPQRVTACNRLPPVPTEN